MSKTIYIGGRLESKEKGNVVAGANAILDDTKGKKQNVINKETDDELLRLEQSKQDNLTFDNTPTENSTNPVTSGGVYTAEKALSDAIEAILLLIPSAATALNKLVDTNTMNSSISTATATFRGTYNAVSDLGLTYQATHAQIEAALDALGLTADNNDFAFVQIPVSDQSQDIAKTERFKFNGTNWLYEYDLNTSGFTAAQWAAINSGITVALVTKLTDLPTAAALQLALNAKQDNLTFDDEPTALSQNPVTSGGIYTAIQAVATALSDYSTTTDGRLNVLEGLVPTEASSSNKLTDKAYVLAQILAATPAFKGQYTTLAELQAVASQKDGDLGIVRTKDSDGMDVFTVYQYLSNAWNVFYSLSYHPQTKPATTGTTGDYPYNGMGRVELAKNMVNTGTELAPVMVNQLTQDMFYKGAVGSRVPNTNTIFVIRYDYVLAENITIPDNCVLEFEGGSISGAYTLTGANTYIKAGLVKIFDTTTTLAGTWNVAEAYPEWFGAVGDGTTDDSGAIQKTISLCPNINFSKVYGVSNALSVSNGCRFYGAGSIKAIAVVESVIVINISSKDNYISVDIDGNELAINGIHAHRLSEFVFIKNCELKNFKATGETQSEGIRLETNVKHIRIENVYIHDVTPVFSGSVGDVEGSAQAILIGNVVDCTISNCTFDNINGYRDTDMVQIGVVGENYTIYESDVIVEGCRFLNVTHRGIKAQCKGIVARNNYFQSEFVNTTPEELGRVRPMCVMGILGSEHSVIENNIADFKRSDAILQLTGNNYIIRNNSFKCNYADSSYLTADSYMIDVSCVNPDWEEKMRTPTYGHQICGNYFEGYFHNGFVGRTVHKSIFYSNSFINITDFVLSFDSTDNTVKDVEFINNTAKCVTGGTYPSFLRMTSEGIIPIIGNKVSGNTFRFLNDRAATPDLFIINNIAESTAILTPNATDTRKVRVYGLYSDSALASFPKGGATSARPTPYQVGGLMTSADYGVMYYDTDLKKPLFFDNVVPSGGSYISIWGEADGARAGVARSGASGSRPASSHIYAGFQYFDTTLGKPIYWSGTAWVDATGSTV